MLGIDEAGRGSVLGPLVVGGFLTRSGRVDGLRDLGVRDSKRLTPAQRVLAFDRLAPVGERLTVVLEPEEIDRSVRKNELNELEAAAFATLVRQCAPDVAYVDACDPVAARFGRRVRELSGNVCPVVARHKADRDLPLVAAASVVAKVSRDRAIEALRARHGEQLGSGYPSDEKTRAFLRELLLGGAAPSWVRASWRTTQDLMPQRVPRALESFR